MNNIVELENERGSISQLAAQAALYSAAKTLFSLQLFLSGPLIVGVAITALAFDREWFGLPKYDLAPYVSILGLGLVLLDIILVNPFVSKWRSLAAKIQQNFDSTILKLPWNKIVYGARPDPEDIEAWAEKNKELVASNEYKDWYRIEVRDLPHEAAVLVCQRANCWWDMKLRLRYNTAIGISGIFLLAFLLGISVWLDLSTTSIFSFVVAPFLPFLSIAAKLMTDNNDAISRLEFLKDAVEESWTQALQRGYNPNSLLLQSQVIQEGIYQNRNQNPLIFDWIAKKFKPKNEALQSKSSKQYVADFKAAHPYLY